MGKFIDNIFRIIVLGSILVNYYKVEFKEYQITNYDIYYLLAALVILYFTSTKYKDVK